MRSIAISIAASITFLMLFACDHEHKHDPVAEQHAEADDERKAYVPGLGSMMITLQGYHTKLYYAGSQQNWELAVYFIHELEETFEDIETYHGQHNNLDIKSLVDGMTLPAIENLETIVKADSVDAFIPAFEQLTISCNSCHATTGYSFIHIQKPEPGDFLNQRFN